MFTLPHLEQLTEPVKTIFQRLVAAVQHVWLIDHQQDGTHIWHQHGTGSPEGVVVAPKGALYSQRDGIATTVVWVKTTGGGDDQNRETWTNTGWVLASSEVSPTGAHNVLSATHPDTVAAAVTRGALIVGDATPKWSRLSVGGAQTVLQGDGTDAFWTAVPITSGIKVNQQAAVAGPNLTLNAALLDGSDYLGSVLFTLLDSAIASIRAKEHAANTYGFSFLTGSGGTVTEKLTLLGDGCLVLTAESVSSYAASFINNSDPNGNGAYIRTGQSGTLLLAVNNSGYTILTLGGTGLATLNGKWVLNRSVITPAGPLLQINQDAAADAAALVKNTHASGHGLQVDAGSTASQLALSVNNYNGLINFLSVNGVGKIVVPVGPVMTINGAKIIATDGVFSASGDDAGGYLIQSTRGLATGSGAYTGLFWNSHASGHGVQINAGSTTAHIALIVNNYQGVQLFKISGAGPAAFAAAVSAPDLLLDAADDDEPALLTTDAHDRPVISLRETVRDLRRTIRRLEARLDALENQ